MNILYECNDDTMRVLEGVRAFCSIRLAPSNPHSSEWQHAFCAPTKSRPHLASKSRRRLFVANKKSLTFCLHRIRRQCGLAITLRCPHIWQIFPKFLMVKQNHIFSLYCEWIYIIPWNFSEITEANPGISAPWIATAPKSWTAAR